MNLDEAKAWIEKKVGRVAMTRGYEYFREDRVEIMDDSSNEYGVIRGTCRGTTVTPYVLWASISKSNSITDSYCSCPIGNNGDCKHIAALLFTWKLKKEPKLKQNTVKPNITPNSKERHLYPGPFSSTLPESNKEYKPKHSKISNGSKITKKKTPRSPFKPFHHDEKPKLEIIGIEDHEINLMTNRKDMDETDRLKTENEILRSQIESLTLQINNLKERVILFYDFDSDSDFDLNKNLDEIKFKRIACENEDKSTEVYLSPSKKSKSCKTKDFSGSPVDRAINILFNREDDFLKGDILGESNSQELLTSM